MNKPANTRAVAALLASSLLASCATNEIREEIAAVPLCSEVRAEVERATQTLRKEGVRPGSRKRNYGSLGAASVERVKYAERALQKARSQRCRKVVVLVGKGLA